MQETCVQCHNGHNDSTKKDWKIGEVVGVLEIHSGRWIGDTARGAMVSVSR